MLNILEALYRGKINPYAELNIESPRYIEAERLKEVNYEKLMAMLNEYEKEQFEKYCLATEASEEAVRYGAFIYGLKVGALLMTEIFAGANQVIETNEL